ncbi:hypothetical protein ANANG_G00044050, partial [Anguilla anguilla]
QPDERQEVSSAPLFLLFYSDVTGESISSSDAMTASLSTSDVSGESISSSDVMPASFSISDVLGAVGPAFRDVSAAAKRALSMEVVKVPLFPLRQPAEPQGRLSLWSTPTMLTLAHHQQTPLLSPSLWAQVFMHAHGHAHRHITKGSA